MKKSAILFCLASLFISGQAAAERYGAAGCGLGSILFESESGTFMQVLAATSNLLSANQCFSITSGTSNCDPTVGDAQSTKTFVVANRASIAKDIARGRGETIQSLAELAGCADPDAVGVTLQENFGQIFPDAQISDEQVGDGVVRVLKRETALRCGNLA